MQIDLRLKDFETEENHGNEQIIDGCLPIDKDFSLFQLKPSVWDSNRGVGLFYKGPDGGTNCSPSLYKSFQLFGVDTHAPSTGCFV